MRGLKEGALTRVKLQDESDSSDDESKDLDLENLSEEDLEDSEAEQSFEYDDASAADEDGDDELMQLKNDMADIPFATLIQAQSGIDSDHKGSKPIDNTRRKNKDFSKNTIVQDKTLGSREASTSLKRKRDNKHAPMEMSSKKPVGRGREAVEVVKIERRDPRFDPDTSGKPNTNAGFTKHNYGFLEEYKQSEMRLLKESILKEKDLAAKARMEKTLGSMQSRQQASKERERRQRVLSEFKKKEKLAEKDGKAPFHLKAAEKNKLYLKDKFDSMKDSKGLDKFMEKKRKRRSQKDRKRALPM